MSTDDVPTGWYTAYQSCLIAGYGLYFLAKWSEFHSKYLDYRALAEGLRVQLFWRVAGLHHSVADHYLRKQRGELDWIRQAIRARTIPATREGMRLHTEDASPEQIDLVLRCWVHDQANYFSTTSVRDHQNSQIIRWVGRGLLVVPVGLAVIKWFLGGGHPLLIGMGLSLAVAAALPAYGKVQAYAEHSKHYRRMYLMFELAQSALQNWVEARKFAEAQHLLLALGKEALAENGDWVLLHRERPPEPKR
ncbi:MAG: hypothetical protein K2R98_24385 [Gemmataceae bacterium]|nr:hypothetical protein [Gemmataceae bacterium]